MVTMLREDRHVGCLSCLALLNHHVSPFLSPLTPFSSPLSFDIHMPGRNLAEPAAAQPVVAAVPWSGVFRWCGCALYGTSQPS